MTFGSPMSAKLDFPTELSQFPTSHTKLQQKMTVETRKWLWHIFMIFFKKTLFFFSLFLNCGPWNIKLCLMFKSKTKESKRKKCLNTDDLDKSWIHIIADSIISSGISLVINYYYLTLWISWNLTEGIESLTHTFFVTFVKGHEKSHPHHSTWKPTQHAYWKAPYYAYSPYCSQPMLATYPNM